MRTVYTILHQMTTPARSYLVNSRKQRRKGLLLRNRKLRFSITVVKYDAILPLAMEKRRTVAIPLMVMLFCECGILPKEGTDELRKSLKSQRTIDPEFWK